MTKERADEIERMVFYRYLTDFEGYLVAENIVSVGRIVGMMQLTLRQELEKELTLNGSDE